MAVGTMAQIVEVCVTLRNRGFEVIIVSSGAVGVGCIVAGLTASPNDISLKQATAAIGQVRLMRMWGDLFAAAELLCGQVLLTYDNLGELIQHKSARNTFESLLKIGVVPIVNENDTVATFESRRRFGDNDRLSALVCSLVGADWLFLLTDVDAVYTANPKDNPDAKRIGIAHDIDELASLVSTGEGAGSAFSTGGMATKLTAARIASASGCRTVILSAKNPDCVLKFCTEKAAKCLSALDVCEDGCKAGVGTLILPKGQHHETDTQRWIVGMKPEGEVVTTKEGAQRLANKEPLLATDIVEVRGDFTENSCVSIRVTNTPQSETFTSSNPTSNFTSPVADTNINTKLHEKNSPPDATKSPQLDHEGNPAENNEDEREVAIGVINFRSNSWKAIQRMSQDDISCHEDVAAIDCENVVTTMQIGGGSQESNKSVKLV